MSKTCSTFLCCSVLVLACSSQGNPPQRSAVKHEAILDPSGTCDPVFDVDCDPDCFITPWDPACGVDGAGGPPPDPGLTPQQIATSLLADLGRHGVIWWWSTDDFQNFQLTAAGDAAEIAVGICAVQPEVCLAVGVGLGVYTIYVTWPQLQALVDALRRGITSRLAAPVTYASYYPGVQADGNCIPPDPDRYVKWRGSDDLHWHYIDWNQAPPPSCWVFPIFRTGPDPGPRWREIPR